MCIVSQSKGYFLRTARRRFFAGVDCIVAELRVTFLRTARRRFAGVERRSCVSQVGRNSFCGRVRISKHAPCDLFQVFERRHGLAEIVERGVIILVKGFGVNPPYFEHEIMRIPEHAPRRGHRSAQQRPGFFEAL